MKLICLFFAVSSVVFSCRTSSSDELPPPPIKHENQNKDGQPNTDPATPSDVPPSEQQTSDPATGNATSYKHKLAAGQEHVCAINSGKVICWGLGLYSQTTALANLIDVDDVIAGASYSCATSNKKLTCGGDPQMIPSTSWTDVTQMSGAYAHACAVRSNGKVICWGESRRATAIAVPSDLATPHQISATYTETYALTNGAIRCWGSCQTILPKTEGFSQLIQSIQGQSLCANYEGKLSCWAGGFSTPSPIYVPTNLGVVDAVTNYGDQFCALANGSVTCWNPYLNGNKLTTVPAGLTGIEQIAAGHDFVCAYKAGKVKCWGTSTSGTLNVPLALQM